MLWSIIRLADPNQEVPKNQYICRLVGAVVPNGPRAVEDNRPYLAPSCLFYFNLNFI